MIESNDASRCRLCGDPSTWHAFIVFRDLKPLNIRGVFVKPPDVRCPIPIHGVCDVCQALADDVTGPEMLRGSWSTLAKMIRDAGLPVPDLDKVTVQWERVVVPSQAAIP